MSAAPFEKRHDAPPSIDDYVEGSIALAGKLPITPEEGLFLAPVINMPHQVLYICNGLAAGGLRTIPNIRNAVALAATQLAIDSLAKAQRRESQSANQRPGCTARDGLRGHQIVIRLREAAIWRRLPPNDRGPTLALREARRNARAPF